MAPAKPFRDRALRGLSAAVALTLFYAAAPAYSFLIQTYDNRRSAYQVKWPNPQAIPVMLNESGTPDLRNETAFRLLREGLEVWESVPSSVAAFNDMGVTSRLPDPRDGINVIAFDQDNTWLDLPRGSGVIAATLMQTDPFSRTITDADIVFNDSGWRFITGADAGSNRVNLKDVMVHEVGHLLGLDHTPLAGDPRVRPTMNPFYGGDGPGETSTLEVDDIAGVSQLYPTVGFQLDTGSISGMVESEEGASLFGVHVIAENLVTGGRISTLTVAEGVHTGCSVFPPAPIGSASRRSGSRFPRTISAGFFANWPLASRRSTSTTRPIRNWPGRSTSAPEEAPRRSIL